MNTLQLALVLVASIWAAVNTLISGYNILPGLVDDPEVLKWVCYGAATLPFGSFLGFFFLGLSDRRLILQALTDAAEPSRAPAELPDGTGG